jgi:hypothetical protein
MKWWPQAALSSTFAPSQMLVSAIIERKLAHPVELLGTMIPAGYRQRRSNFYGPRGRSYQQFSLSAHAAAV